jgi:hypothetical protein
MECATLIQEHKIGFVGGWVPSRRDISDGSLENLGDVRIMVNTFQRKGRQASPWRFDQDRVSSHIHGLQEWTKRNLSMCGALPMYMIVTDSEKGVPLPHFPSCKPIQLRHEWKRHAMRLDHIPDFTKNLKPDVESSDEDNVPRRSPSAHKSHLWFEQVRIDPDMCCTGTFDMLAWVTPDEDEDTQMSNDDAHKDMESAQLWGMVS